MHIIHIVFHMGKIIDIKGILREKGKNGKPGIPSLYLLKIGCEGNIMTEIPP